MRIDSNVLIIFYVKDQEKSTAFYTALFDREPTIHVPGMTEMPLTETLALGLMPGEGIVKILQGKVKDPNENNDYPRCELYIRIEDPEASYQKALMLGAKGISGLTMRNWGEEVAYCSDFDGNLIAFAKMSKGKANA